MLKLGRPTIAKRRQDEEEELPYEYALQNSVHANDVVRKAQGNQERQDGRESQREEHRGDEAEDLPR